MNRFWTQILAASFTASMGGVMLQACAHDDSTMYIQQVVAPPAGASLTASCLYQAPSTTTPAEFAGQLDVGLASSYSPVIIVGNQLIARGDNANARTETNRVQLRGAVVRVTDSQGNQLSTFTSLTEGSVDPSLGTTPGFGQAAVTIVDPGTVDLLRGDLSNRAKRKTILSFFKVFGQTLGGTYVESNEFQHVIQICNGCSVSFPAEAVDPDKPFPNCLKAIPAGAAGSSTTLAIPCVAGQDQATDCRLCQGVDACDPTKLR